MKRRPRFKVEDAARTGNVTFNGSWSLVRCGFSCNVEASLVRSLHVHVRPQLSILMFV